MDVIDLSAIGAAGLIEDLNQGQALSGVVAPAADSVSRTNIDLWEALRRFLLPEAADDPSRRN